MNSKVFYYFLIGTLVIAAALGLIAFYYAAFGDINNILPPQFRSAPPPTPSVPAQSNGPQVNLSVDTSGRLVLSWKNLGAGVRDIHIFRAREGQPRWSLWKTISISNLAEGFVQLQAAYSEGLLSYVYRFEGIGGGGESLWTSSSTSITSGGTATPFIPPTEPSTPSPQPPTPSSGGGTTTPPPASSSTSSTTSSPETTNTVTYYTPQGDVSGSTSLTTEQFWVKEINKKIQIGWSNLNPSSTEVIILRASTENGPWSVLFRQSQPVTNEPYSLFIVDDAVSQTAFYKLNSLSTSDTTLDSYGPVAFHPSGL